LSLVRLPPEANLRVRVSFSGARRSRRQNIYDFQNSCHNAPDRRVNNLTGFATIEIRGRLRKRRTKSAVKLLETNDPAKPRDFVF
jgi:hypothetical protein